MGKYPNMSHLTKVQKKALVCSECIREGTPDIFIIVREIKETDIHWAGQYDVLNKHKEEAHGDK